MRFSNIYSILTCCLLGNASCFGKVHLIDGVIHNLLFLIKIGFQYCNGQTRTAEILSGNY